MSPKAAGSFSSSTHSPPIAIKLSALHSRGQKLILPEKIPESTPNLYFNCIWTVIEGSFCCCNGFLSISSWMRLFPSAVATAAAAHCLALRLIALPWVLLHIKGRGSSLSWLWWWHDGYEYSPCNSLLRWPDINASYRWSAPERLRLVPFAEIYEQIFLEA